MQDTDVFLEAPPGHSQSEYVVVEILVAVGDVVLEGVPVVRCTDGREGARIRVLSPGAGTVVDLPVRVGDRLPPGARLLSISPNLPETRVCPFCAEEIKFVAIKCKHCGSSVDPVIAATGNASGASFTGRTAPLTALEKTPGWDSEFDWFGLYIHVCLEKFNDFSGRASRADYWVFHLTNLLIYLALGIAATKYSQSSVGLGLFFLATITPSIAVSVRRLHDTNRSGLWLLVGLVPLVGLVLPVFFLEKGDPHVNQYGGPVG